MGAPSKSHAEIGPPLTAPESTEVARWIALAPDAWEAARLARCWAFEAEEGTDDPAAWDRVWRTAHAIGLFVHELRMAQFRGEVA